MIDLDPTQLPRNIATILLLRGAELPPVVWGKTPNRAAKRTLDEIDDQELFGRGNLPNEAMSGVVRGLLYLWHGWISECNMYCQIAPEKEKLYIAALCERHNGRQEASKQRLRELKGHDLYVPLVDYAKQAIGLGMDASLRRMHQILEQDPNWEPFVFADLYEQAAAEKLCHAAEEVVRKIQCKEFELLFAHCFQLATGQELRIKARRDSDRDSQARLERTRQLAEKNRQRTASARASHSAQSSPKAKKEPASSATSKTAPAASKSGPAQAKPAAAGVKIGCPKCRAMATVPESHRGKPHKCQKCGTSFMIPGGDQKRRPGSSAPAAPGTFGLLCPKCRKTLRVPEASRGKKHKCDKCSAVFVIPHKKMVGAKK